MLVLEALEDPIVDRLRLAASAPGADEEVVGVAEHPAEIELDHLDGLLVGRVAGDLLDQLLALHHAAAPLAHAALR